MGLVPKGESPDALWFGIGVHIALAEWYQKGFKRGPHPAKTFAEWAKDEERWLRASQPHGESEWYDEPKYVDAVELGTAMLEGYVEEYGKDKQWEILAIEQSFRVNVTHHGKLVAVFASTFDGVERDASDGEVYLLEHKTAGQISTAYLELDDQAGSYWAVATAILRAKGILGPKEHIAGIVYNFLRKSMPDDRPVNAEGMRLNQDGSISKRQGVPRFVREIIERSPGESKRQMERMADEIVLMNAVRDGLVPLTKSTMKDCTFCEFFTMCTLHERGGDDWREIMRSEYVVQDPYEDRRKSASW
jgi:hypothetical protein